MNRRSFTSAGARAECCNATFDCDDYGSRLAIETILVRRLETGSDD
jgi:hypothetical protein